MELLTQTVTPGKIYYAGIYFLASYDDLEKSHQGPRKRDGRSDQEDDESHSHHTKRRKIETDKADENSTENIDACLVHEVGDGEVEEELFGVPSDVEHDEHVNENHINEEGEPNAKAAKSDDSKVPIHLWNDRVVEQLKEQWAENKRKIAGKLTEEYDSTGKGSLQHLDLSEGSSDRIRFDRWLDLMRAASINCWKRRVKRDFEKWYEETGKHHADAEQVRIDGDKAVERAQFCSFWDWDRGSSIFFWRWPEDYQDIVREGLAPMFDGDPPNILEFQPPYKDNDVKAKVKEKLQRVLDRGYVEITDIKFVEALMYMFHVPKGKSDIRMVYDATKSRLNESLFAPWFGLPTIDAITRWVICGSWLADSDYGDMFLNFKLHKTLQKFCGIDLTELFPNRSRDESQKVIGVWLRNAMGLRPSPYASIQGGLRAKYIVIGDRHDKENAYQWDHVVLNLPFAKNYIANLPRLKKIRVDGGLASEVVQYVDDLRIVASSAEQAWLASSQMAKGLCYLGLQDAARKRRRSSRRPGAWAGCIVAAEEGKPVTKLVTHERWCKLRFKIRWIAKQVGYTDEFSPSAFDGISNEFNSKIQGFIHFKTTEKLVGFIVYVCQTYSALVPYLKGIYLTLNSWRNYRDNEGWVTSEGKLAARREEKKRDG